MHDWSLTIAPETAIAGTPTNPLTTHLRIEKFRSRVFQLFASNALDPGGLLAPSERQPLYSLLNSELDDIQRDMEQPEGR